MQMRVRKSLVRIALVAAVVIFAFRSWVDYVGRKSHYMVDAYVKIVDWDIARIKEDELCRRFLIDPDSTSFFISTEINGVRIAPSVFGAKFSAQGTYWSYQKKVRDVLEQMDKFAERNSDWKYEKAGIQVTVLDSSKTRHIDPPIAFEQEFDVFPASSEAVPHAP